MGNDKAQSGFANQQMEKTLWAGGQTDKQGSLYFQLKHCSLKRKCLKSVHFGVHCLVPRKKGSLMTTVLQGTEKRNVKIMDLTGMSMVLSKWVITPIYVGYKSLR